MVPQSMHDFFVALAGAAAALTGLLFVAISVVPERVSGHRASLVEQARAASALNCFLVPLATALVALIPGAHLAIPAIALSVAGLLFVAATLRRHFSRPKDQREKAWGLAGLIGFAAALSVMLGYGVVALVAPQNSGAVTAIASVTIALILIGVERAWALVGGRSAGRAATLTDLIRGDQRTPPAGRD